MFSKSYVITDIGRILFPERTFLVVRCVTRQLNQPRCEMATSTNMLFQ